MKKLKTSLIVSTYNWHQALDLCLKSIFLQTTIPDEILIADDGSSDETKLLVKAVSLYSPCPIVHVWQPDEGFKLAQIRNKAIAKAKYEYIIQIDGDLILEKNFISDHLYLVKSSNFITGSRVLLSNDTSLLLLKNRSIDIKNYASHNNNFLNGFRL
jgi:glycosyltransferase involved in cell wall biosynthesis